MEKKTTKTASKKSAEPKAKKAKTKKTLSTAASETKPASAVGRCGGKSCRVGSCKRAYRAKGYCGVHYRKWRQGEYGQARFKICSDTACSKPMATGRHGYCEDHYQNYYVKGNAPVKAPAAAAPAPAKESA